LVIVERIKYTFT